MQDDEKLTMWDVSGHEMRLIIRDEAKSFSDFNRFVQRDNKSVIRQFVKARINPWYRDRLIAYCGELVFCRRLILIRKSEGMPTEEMQKHYDMLNAHKRMPMPARAPEVI